jgi:hypothetical protein
MELASLVPFQGPKKSQFSGPTTSNAPRNDVAPLKTITYRAIKTTGTLIVIFSFNHCTNLDHYWIVNSIILSYHNLLTKTFPITFPITRSSFYSFSLHHKQSFFPRINIQIFNKHLWYSSSVRRFHLYKDEIALHH